MKKIRLWFESLIRAILKKILREEYFISADIGIRETEIMIVKYSYRTGQIEIISDHHLQKTPLKEIEKEIRFLAKKYNASAVADYPIHLRDYFNLRY